MKIKPHTINDLDRYGPLAVQPLPLSSPVWDGASITNANMSTLTPNACLHLPSVVTRSTSAGKEGPASLGE
jgi:hypothetical protein